LTKTGGRARIEEIGIVPAVRVSMPEHATFAAEALHRANVPIVEITMTVPNAAGVIARLARSLPEMVVARERSWTPKPQAAVWLRAQSS
jgi:2-keto-3-deoxy-6-phosphogluconate aldolase